MEPSRDPGMPCLECEKTESRPTSAREGKRPGSPLPVMLKMPCATPARCPNRCPSYQVIPLVSSSLPSSHTPVPNKSNQNKTGKKKRHSPAAMQKRNTTTSTHTHAPDDTKTTRPNHLAVTLAMCSQPPSAPSKGKQPAGRLCEGGNDLIRCGVAKATYTSPHGTFLEAFLLGQGSVSNDTPLPRSLATLPSHMTAWDDTAHAQSQLGEKGNFSWPFWFRPRTGLAATAPATQFRKRTRAAAGPSHSDAIGPVVANVMSLCWLSRTLCKWTEPNKTAGSVVRLSCPVGVGQRSRLLCSVLACVSPRTSTAVPSMWGNSRRPSPCR